MNQYRYDSVPMASPTQSMDMSLNKLPGDSEGQGESAILQFMGSQRLRQDLAAKFSN